MAETTGIQWCHHTFNPWRGCTKVSAGCAKCYAEKLSHRNPGVLGVWGPGGKRVVAAEPCWREPLKWDRKARAAGERRRVFRASLADVFEEWDGPMVTPSGNPYWWCHGSLSNSPIPSTGLTEGCRLATMDDIRERLFQLIEDTPGLDWMVLTKRPEYAKEWLDDHVALPNLWLGVSAEDQETADARIPVLLDCPAAVRFVSAEPLLGSIEFASSLGGTQWIGGQRGCDGTTGGLHHHDERCKPGLDLVILGGESGRDARPCDVAWIRAAKDQLVAAGVACYVKQLGARPQSTSPVIISGDARRAMTLTSSVLLSDSHGGDMAEWPEDLRVREMPKATVTA